jgi:hypothetical protein
MRDQLARPLVLWGVAGSLDMLGRTSESVRVYRRLIRRGVDSVAHGDCGEGLALGSRIDRGLLVSHCAVS